MAGTNQPVGAPVPTTPTIGQTPVTGQNQTPTPEPAANPQPKPPDIFKRIQHKTIAKGSLVNFQYLRYKHDPYPLIICSSIYGDGKLAGVNLHYLTFKYIRYLIKMYCGKAFSYPLIKGNNYIKNAFRTYKRLGVRNPKVLDCDFLLSILGSIRSFNPNEVEKMREEIQKQLQQRTNPKADEMTEEFHRMLVPDPNNPRHENVKGYEALDRFGEPTWPKSNPPLQGPKPTIGDGRRNPGFLLPPE